MNEKDENTPEARAPRLSRRTMLGGLAAASILPWLISSAQSQHEEEQAFDPSSARGVTQAAPLPRQQHTATSLGGGFVLVAGGLYQGTLADVQILGPDGTLLAAAPLNTPRYAHAAVSLPDGRVVVLGGYGLGPLDDVEIYNPHANTWTIHEPLSLPRYQHSAARISDSKILVTGGFYQGILSDSETYVL